LQETPVAAACADNDIARVVSWNVNYAVTDRMRSQAGFIRKLQPDLLCLQEVNLSSAQELVERAGLDWLVSGVGLRPSKQDDTLVRKRGSAIAGRGTAPVRTWLLDDVPLPERLVLTEVKLHDMTWTVASYHAPPGVTWREKKAQQAVGFARWLQGAQTPIVVGGDFNTPEVDAPDFGLTRTHLHTGHRWLDDVRQVRPHGPLAISYCTRRRGGKPPTPWRFDAVWVSRHFVVHDVQYPYEQSVAARSDHSAVVCDLSLVEQG
jgi:endonuclease/exonuclease/phosphatase family metal-dependent hydrolase